MQTEQAQRAAFAFMQHKGYPSPGEPARVETVEDQPNLWYFFFELPEGTLELEVEWTGEKWSWDVMDFVHHQDKGGTLATASR